MLRYRLTLLLAQTTQNNGRLFDLLSPDPVATSSSPTFPFSTTPAVPATARGTGVEVEDIGGGVGVANVLSPCLDARGSCGLFLGSDDEGGYEGVGAGIG